MGKLTKNDMEDLREICSLGCDYSDAKEAVKEITEDIIKELDGQFAESEFFNVVDAEGTKLCVLDEFVEIFWNKATEIILNVVESQP